MTQLLQKQYALVKRTRAGVLAFIETVVGNDLATAVPAYENKSILHMLVHNADCYLYWLPYMALEQKVEWLNYGDYKNVADIRQLFMRMDEMMDIFLDKFEKSMDMPIDNARSRSDKLNATPLMIFTHVITHEFHHKGQVMAMCRQLGYPPPETDIYRLFY